jgi:uncharacterized repeat protein (TIGR02543 family)
MKAKFSLALVLIMVFSLAFQVTAAQAAPGTYFTTDDNEDNAHTGVADGDMDVDIWNYYAEHPIEFNINVPAGGLPTSNAYLTIRAYDVDEEQGQKDEVFLNGTSLGFLSGTNGTWNTTPLAIPAGVLVEGNNLVQINVDTLHPTVPTWLVKIDWGQIVVDGGVGTPGRINSMTVTGYSVFDGTVTVNVDVVVEALAAGTFNLETALYDSADNNVATVNQNGFAMTLGEIVTKSFVFTYPVDLPTGTFTIQGYVFNADTGNLDNTKTETFLHTVNVGPGDSYTVTYNGNGNTAGIPPTDGTNYVIGDTVTVLGNTGSMTKTGFTFNGWNTVADGSGTSVLGGETFLMGNVDVTLYAQWAAIHPTYTVTYNGNSADGGTVPVDSNNYLSGQVVTVLDNTGGLFKTGFTFAGWSFVTDGSGYVYAPGDPFVIGADKTLYAQWTLDATAPTATTNAPSGLTSTDVTLNGTVNANGDSTTASFDIGLDTSYGLNFAAIPSPFSGSTDTPVSVALTGLTAGVTYHYRVKANNGGGTTYGSDLAFTAAPSVSNWAHCADEGGTCSFTGTKWVRYGVPGSYAYGQFTNSVVCGTAAFGYDPIVNILKSCDVEVTDITPPQTSIVYGPALYTLSKTAGFNYSGADETSAPANLTFQCQLDSYASFACNSGSVGWNNLSLGKHTFTVYAVDEAGNADPTPAVYTWTVQAERALNGGFNTYAGTSKIPTSWVKSKTFGSSDGKDTAYKKEGTASVKIVGNGTTKTLTQTLNLSGNPGDRLTFSFWERGSAIPSGGLCNAQVILYFNTTAKLTKTINCRSGTYNAFEKKTILISANAIFNKVVIKFTYAKASGTIWFDLVSLIK